MIVDDPAQSIPGLTNVAMPNGQANIPIANNTWTLLLALESGCDSVTVSSKLLRQLMADTSGSTNSSRLNPI